MLIRAYLLGGLLNKIAPLQRELSTMIDMLLIFPQILPMMYHIANVHCCTVLIHNVVVLCLMMRK